MVMTNVHKPTKTKFINIDTKFSDDLTHNPESYKKTDIFSFTIPERINDVKTIKVANAEIPYSFYNITTSLGNNHFKLTTYANSSSTNSTEYIITVKDGTYTPDTLITAINTALDSSNNISLLSFSIENNHTIITSSSADDIFTIQFDVNIQGVNDKYMLKSKLGWILGFREQSVKIAINGTAQSNSIINTNTINYIYLIMDEYSSVFTNTFISPQAGFCMNKKILAKITVDNNNYAFGDIIHTSIAFGTLLTDTRTYIGKTDLQKMTVQLVNCYGIPIVLNGLDFSFTLNITHE
jgi:hypothetical protein